jgi:hypothetical protein
MWNGEWRMENTAGGIIAVVGKAVLVAVIVVSLILIISTGACPVP